MSHQALEPLVPLHEEPGPERVELPGELGRIYGSGISFPSSSVYANFVATVDGVVALPGVEGSNRVVSDGSEADRFVMAVLRALADAVVVGSGTMRAAPRTLWTAEQAYPQLAAPFVELRRRLGRALQPEVAIVTASGSIDTAHPVLEERAVVLTTARGSARLRGRLPATTQVVVLAGDHSVDPAAAVATLRERGHELILSEAGPMLFGSMLAAGVVDELFLTVSPLLAGRSPSAARRSLVDGVELLPELRRHGRLVDTRRHGDHLFLRYRLDPAA